MVGAGFAAAATVAGLGALGTTAAGVDGALGVVVDGVAGADGAVARVESAVQPARAMRGTISSGRRMKKFLGEEGHEKLERYWCGCERGDRGGEQYRLPFAIENYGLTDDPRPGYQEMVFPVLLVKLTPSEEMLLRVPVLAFAE